MWSLTCKCLNVMLETGELKTVDVDSLEVDEKLSQDVFFNQEIRQVLRLSKAIKRLPSLVHTRTIGNWTFEQCLNCKVHTHAVTNIQKSLLVLVNANLLTNPEIEALKKSKSYSKVYKILVFPNDEKERRYEYLPAEVEKSIRSLKQKADEFINIETLASEERVRIYNDEQQQMLTDFVDKTHADHKTLKRVLLNHHHEQSERSSSVSNKTRSTNMELKQEDNVIKASCQRKVPDTFDQIVKASSPQTKVLTIMDHSPVFQHSSLEKKNSFDAEGIFELEGMDDAGSFNNSEESDNEDSIGIPIRQPRGGHQQQQDNIAQSLPMNIPIYMAAIRPHHNDESDEEPTENTRDIAASMQALARSVNGDTVFGDLPRNRSRRHI